jgi:hypothetical protein
MGLIYTNLDAVTRQHMLDESQLGGHYISPRLTNLGRTNWVSLFDQAIELHNDDWLAGQLLDRCYMADSEQYTRNGVTRSRQINKPHSAMMLAEGEFNRYYLRGLCRRATAEGATALQIYRGKQVAVPRPESEAKLGTMISVTGLLEALRRHDFVSVDAAFAIPNGPNSGLTARLP